MTQTVVLASIVLCAVACLLLGVRRRRARARIRRTDSGQAAWPDPVAGPQPAMIGVPVAAGTPMVAGAPMAVGAPAPASSSSVARCRRNSGSSHFSRPRANLRPARQPLR